MKFTLIAALAAAALSATVAPVSAAGYQIVYRCTDSAGLDVAESFCTGLPKPGCDADVSGSSTGPAFEQFEDSTGPGSAIIGDPQFKGLRGQDYQVHGMPDRVFNLVSDKDSSVNALFVFRSEGRCPVVNGVKIKEGCFSHAGTYLGQIALQTAAGDHIFLEAGDYQSGFRNVSVNGQQVKVGASALDYTVQHSHSHIVTVKMSQFSYTFTNSDMFINQEVSLNDPSAIDSVQAHGMLGQTVSGKVYSGKFKHIAGTPTDYMLPEEDIKEAMWSTQYKYNLFN